MQRNHASIFVHCCLACLALGLAPLSADAAQIDGRVTVDASGAEVLPEGQTSVPLEEIEVHVGVIERLGTQGIDAFYLHINSGFTDVDGNYSIEIGDDPPPNIPTSMVDHVVVLILESEDKGVAVYDNGNDQDSPACLGTQVIRVANRGSTQVDIEITVKPDNDSTYQAQMTEFVPTEDQAAMPPFGIMVHCDREALGTRVMPDPLYDQRGLTNSKPDRFAHLAAHYARVFDAYKFTRDGLGKTGFTPVRVNAWEATNILSYSYGCATNAIQMPPERSQILGSDADSRIYAMRHEYGHHLMCASSIAGNSGLPALTPGDTYHGGLHNSDSAGAWIEGFAAWYAAAVSEGNGESRPQLQVTKAGEIDLLFGDAQLDDPFTAGEQPTHGALGEEFAIATLMWQITDGIDSATLFDSLEAAGAGLDNFNDVYTTLVTDAGVASFFDTLSCDFFDTGVTVFGIDCLFIDRGFYHDIDGDGFYGPDDLAGGNEIVGSTRWPLSMRGPEIFRPDTPEIEGSQLLLTVEDQDGAPVAAEAFNVAIEYDAPFETENSEYRRSIAGSGPYQITILLPGKPSRALITPVTEAKNAPDPLIIESAFFHDAVNPFRVGGVAPLLAEHIFVVEVPEPGAMASALAALVALSGLRRRD